MSDASDANAEEITFKKKIFIILTTFADRFGPWGMHLGPGWEGSDLGESNNKKKIPFSKRDLRVDPDSPGRYFGSWDGRGVGSSENKNEKNQFSFS